jgi:4-alpha-glucanotransferase
MAAFQDILNLGNDARMNTPSTLGGKNWCWRVREEAFNDNLASDIKNITGTYRRNMC